MGEERSFWGLSYLDALHPVRVLLCLHGDRICYPRVEKSGGPPVPLNRQQPSEVLRGRYHAAMAG